MRYLPLLFLLTGCPEIARTPVEVKMPIAIPCHVEEPAVAQWPTLAIKRDAGMFEKTRTVLAELELRKAYELQLLAAIRGCR